MTKLKAKVIVPDNFWILYDSENSKAGICYHSHEKFYLLIDDVMHQSDDILNLFNKFDIVEFIEESKTDNKNYDIKGYPIKTKPFNEQEMLHNDITHFTFTKTEKSNSKYCAGYYIVKFNFGWVAAFCPKVSTIEKNEYKGPFKTELEMKQKLKDSKND